MQELTTVAEVFDALGGNGAVEQLTDSKPTAVCNWRTAGKFPARFHLLMTQALARSGKQAPASLWGVPELDKAPS